MSLLCLDLGTNMGYAISSKGAVVSGSVNFASRRFEGGGMRYLKLQRWLDQLHKSSKITKVHFEEVRRHIGTDAAHVYGGLLAILTAWCEDNLIPYEGVTVQAIKKFATGKGNADKHEMIAAVKARWKLNPQSHDEADALALLQMKLYEVMDA